MPPTASPRTGDSGTQSIRRTRLIGVAGAAGTALAVWAVAQPLAGMRRVETLLLLANLVALLVLVVPLPREARWMRHSAPIALLVMGVQLLVEGPRWQMVSAYALAGLFFVIWLLRHIAPAGGPAQQSREGSRGFRQHNTFQVEELVSHGYIVAAIDQPYTAAKVVFPDGHQATGLSLDELGPLIRQSYSPTETAPILNGRAFNDGIAPYLAHDVRFTLDQLAALDKADPHGILTGRLDLRRAGLFGVSLGGIVGAEACRLDPRLRACLVMDAPMPTDVVKAGLQQPAMWITRDAETMQREGWSQRDIDEHLNSMRTVFASLPGDGYFVRVRGMFHLDLTDFPLLSPLASRVGLSGPIGAQRAHDIINAYSLAFFDRHLKGRPAALLDGPAEQYPEVLFETRRP